MLRPNRVFACNLPQQRIRKPHGRGLVPIPSINCFYSSPVAKFEPDRSFLPLARQVLWIAVGMGNFAAALREPQTRTERFKTYMRKR